MTENNNPPIAPTAKANQNTSFYPNHIKGTNLKIEERMVRGTGIIVLL